MVRLQRLLQKRINCIVFCKAKLKYYEPISITTTMLLLRRTLVQYHFTEQLSTSNLNNNNLY